MFNAIKTGIWLTALTILFIFLGGLIGGRSGMILAFGFALVMNLGSYWFSDKIVLKMYKAKPVTEAEYPRFVQTVNRLAKAANLPVPKIVLIPTEASNAFATGRSPQHAVVAATEGILHLLTDEELEDEGLTPATRDNIVRSIISNSLDNAEDAENK